MKWKPDNIIHGGTQNEGVAESSRDIPYCNLVTKHSFRYWRKECLSENVCVPSVLNYFNEDLYHETIMRRSSPPEVFL